MRRARFTKHGMLAIARNAWGAEFSVALDAPEPFEVYGSVAVVQVCGPITNHDEGWFDSYDAIKQRLGAALASPASSVVLEFDSPGGDCAGCYETSRQLRAMAKKAGKKLYAVSSGLMASAAYALACAADFIACPETSFCGSIGVIEMLVDQVQADRAYGLNFAVIASGDHKADGNPHTALDLSTLTEATARVKSLADGFFALVAESRPSLSSAEALRSP